jgi:hypothetical protein
LSIAFLKEALLLISLNISLIEKCLI